MPHSVKIEDKLYDRMKSYCDLNGTSPYAVAREAIDKYLNEIMYGDAPFMKKEKDENRQISAETPVNFDKNTEETPYFTEVKNETMPMVDTEKVKSLSAEKTDEQAAIEHNVPEVRPKKRRL